MTRRPPRSTRTDTLFPYTTLFRSVAVDVGLARGDRLGRLLHDRLAPDVEALLLDVAGLQDPGAEDEAALHGRSEEHTSELQSLMRISYAVFCLKKKSRVMMRTKKEYDNNRIRQDMQEE